MRRNFHQSVRDCYVGEDGGKPVGIAAVGKVGRHVIPGVEAGSSMGSCGFLANLITQDLYWSLWIYPERVQPGPD